MVYDLLTKLGQERGYMPNNLTIGMGELIRKARDEIGLSQADLAKKIYRRQASVSDMENGKMQPDAETLVYLSLVLLKPISYFFPKQYNQFSDEGILHPLLQELVMNAAGLSKRELRSIIVQVKALERLGAEDLE